MTSPTEAPASPVPGRPRRLGLYGPFAALAMALIAWGGAWLWMETRIEQGLDAAARQVGAAGGTFSWSERQVSGYPFRFDVDFTNLKWRGSDGWGFHAPELKSETSMFAFGRWVAYAPAGLNLIRPKGGDVVITARVLRASVSDMTVRPPTFSLEGVGLSFTPAAGAAPYVLAGAAELHVHTRAGPSDQGAFLIELDGGQPAPGGKLAALAGGGPVKLAAEAIYDHADAFSGPGWTPAAKSWAVAGGRLRVRRLKFEAGTFAIDGHGAGLTLDADGRLAGELDSTVTQGRAALAALAAAGAMTSESFRTAALVLAAAHAESKGSAAIDFQAGRTTVGPAALGPSPKVY